MAGGSQIIDLRTVRLTADSSRSSGWEAGIAVESQAKDWSRDFLDWRYLGSDLPLSEVEWPRWGWYSGSCLDLWRLGLSHSEEFEFGASHPVGSSRPGLVQARWFGAVRRSSRRQRRRTTAWRNN